MGVPSSQGSFGNEPKPPVGAVWMGPGRSDPLRRGELDTQQPRSWARCHFSKRWQCLLLLERHMSPGGQYELGDARARAADCQDVEHELGIVFLPEALIGQGRAGRYSL